MPRKSKYNDRRFYSFFGTPLKFTLREWLKRMCVVAGRKRFPKRPDKAARDILKKIPGPILSKRDLRVLTEIAAGKRAVV